MPYIYTKNSIDYRIENDCVYQLSVDNEMFRNGAKENSDSPIVMGKDTSRPLGNNTTSERVEVK